MATIETSAFKETLLSRISHLEEEVGKLTHLLEESREIVDKAARLPDAAKNGVSFEARVGNALQLARRLTAPDTVARFEQLLEMAREAPELLAMLKEIGEDVISRIPPQGLHLDERLEAMAVLAEKLTDPLRMARLTQLLDLLNAAPDLLTAVQGMGEDLINKLPAQSLRLDERLEAALPVLDKLTEPKVLAKVSLLLAIVERMPEMEIDLNSEYMKKAADCEIDLGRILHLLSAAGSAFCQASKEEKRRMGLLGMMRATSDRDRQVAIGFLMTFLKKFGQQLKG